MSKNPQNIKKMFDYIAKNYDKLNNIMTLGLHKKIKKNAVSKLNLKNSKILDLCTGTGDLANILKSKYSDCEVTGIDFSEKMLEIANEKHPDITFLQADCTNLPFEDDSFDLCVISFGLRNIDDMQKAVKEIHRVLKKDGMFINIDLGKPNRFFNLFFKPYMYIWVSILGKIFHGDETPYKYLAISNEKFPSQKELCEIFEKAGFYMVKNKDYAFGQIASQSALKK